MGKPHLLSSVLQTLTPALSSLPLLVPGCGNFRLSKHLYDAGYTSITNVDFSKVVISNMLCSNIGSRPLMRRCVMGMTAMQFEDEYFGAVIDKGELDALMEPELGPTLGNQYLSEVKRVLKPEGKFVCLTLAESHVLGWFWLKKMDTPDSLYSTDHPLSMPSTPPWLQDCINFIQVGKIILILVLSCSRILEDNQLSGTLNLSSGYKRSL